MAGLGGVRAIAHRVVSYKDKNICMGDHNMGDANFI